MPIAKILEMLSVDKLDESKQTEIQDALTTIIDTKAVELSESKLEEALVEEKEKLVEEYEQKFETYKDDVTSKFSNFVDSVLDEEMVIPEKIVRYARLGELYEDLIDQFKVRLAIDEGLLNGEVKSMLKEAKDEITSLRDEVNSLTGTKLQLEQDAKKMATHIHLRKKCDGLTESQKASVMSIFEGSTVEEIDKKFELVSESIVTKEEGTKVDEGTEGSEGADDTKVDEGKGTSQAEPTKEVVTEGSLMDQWKKILSENKF